MNSIKRFFLRLLFLSVTLLCTVLLLTSCDFAADRLSDLGVPDFNESKFTAVERYYRDYYVSDIPEPDEMAEKTAALYFENYHEKIDTGNSDEVTDALITCYVHAIGDRYSKYRTPVEYEEYDEDMSGTYYGIGVLVSYDEVGGALTVNEVYSGSGAEEAGINVGDVIYAVEGRPVSEIGYNKTVSLIKGEENTYVNISLRRDGAELTLDVIRKRVDTKNVTYSIDENKIGYIKITSFKSNTASQFVEAVSFLEENGAVGVIYDLRSNPGGYLSSVVSILSYIAPDDAIIVSFSNDYGAPKYDNHSHSFLIPSVVLCNENTASAGELFTAAMRDFDDKFGYLEVTTVGNTTYGKGVMQSTFELGDGSTLTMTVAFYTPPCGENYDGEGIKPDVKTDAVEGMDAQLDAAYTEIANLVK